MPVASTRGSEVDAPNRRLFQHNPYEAPRRPGLQCSWTGTLPADWHCDRRQRFMDVETVTKLRRRAMSMRVNGLKVGFVDLRRLRSLNSEFLHPELDRASFKPQSISVPHGRLNFTEPFGQRCANHLMRVADQSAVVVSDSIRTRFQTDSMGPTSG